MTPASRTMNLELCKFPCVHLTRFRLAQKHSATVKAHTCALSWHSPFEPLLKKRGADHENFSNFRPVSNLYCLSKVTEKAVAAQLSDHLNGKEGLLEDFQSAYKCDHNTETALVKVHNDILKAVDDNTSVILLLLDLSAAFVYCRSHDFGIKTGESFRH